MKEGELENVIERLNKLLIEQNEKPMDKKQTNLFNYMWYNFSYRDMLPLLRKEGLLYRCDDKELKSLMRYDSPRLTKLIEKALNYHGEKGIIKGNLRTVIEQSFKESDESPNPVPPQLPSDEGDETASKCGVFTETETSFVNTEYMNFTISLDIRNPEHISREDIKREAFVKSRKPGSVDSLFERREINNWRLEALLEGSLLKKNQRWLEQLVDCIYTAMLGSKPQQVRSMFRSADGKLFTSILDCIENKSDESDSLVTFIVIFHENISERYVYNAPDVGLATLTTAVVLATRLAWEVCRVYLPQFDNLKRQSLDQINIVLRELKNQMEYIEIDAENRRQGEANNNRNEDRLRDSFESEDEKLNIERNLSEQQGYKDTIKKKCEIIYGDKNEATAALDKIQDAMTALQELNRIVFMMVTRQLAAIARTRKI